MYVERLLYALVIILKLFFRFHDHCANGSDCSYSGTDTMSPRTLSMGGVCSRLSESINPDSSGLSVAHHCVKALLNLEGLGPAEYCPRCGESVVLRKS